MTQWVVNDFLYERMPYYTRRDLAYVLDELGSVQYPHRPGRACAGHHRPGFIAWASGAAGRRHLGTPGIGTSSHLLS